MLGSDTHHPAVPRLLCLPWLHGIVFGLLIWLFLSAPPLSPSLPTPQYTVEMYTDLLDHANPTLAHRHRPPGTPARRFLVVDAAVAALYGPRLTAYFEAHAIPTRTLVLPGEEENKTLPAVHALFEALVDFGLHRREPILAIGGGVVLDIVGFAASMYRRGVPYIRVPTTLLALVDASVGVKTGVDWADPVHGGLKNRMGAFYPPLAAFLDVGFVATQDKRNVVNGLGEVMKLALVRSAELFDLLEAHGRALIDSRFCGRPAGLPACANGHAPTAAANGHAPSSSPGVPPPPPAAFSDAAAAAGAAAPAELAAVATRVVELSVQTMLEELGPNLWEANLERVVDYGHTFSKILEMNHPTGPDALMHGEAVNIDGVMCVVLAARRGWIPAATRDRVLRVMAALGLPTWHDGAGVEVLWAGLVDAVEHRGGRQRLPLVVGIGEAVVVNDVTLEELRAALDELRELHAPGGALALGGALTPGAGGV